MWTKFQALDDSSSSELSHEPHAVPHRVQQQHTQTHQQSPLRNGLAARAGDTPPKTLDSREEREATASPTLYSDASATGASNKSTPSKQAEPPSMPGSFDF